MNKYLIKAAQLDKKGLKILNISITDHNMQTENTHFSFKKSVKRSCNGYYF